jgi:hypothetical protein
MTFHFLYGSAYNQTALNALAGAMDNWATAEFKPILSNQNTYDFCEARGLTQANDLFSVNGAGSGVGGSTGGPHTNHSCIAIKRVTGFTGRSARGRVYFPLHGGMVAANEDFISTTARDEIVDALNEIDDYAGAVSWVHVVVQRWSEGVKLDEGVVRTVLGYVAVDTEIDTQRRRMPSK